jgi:hypothetical protein
LPSITSYETASFANNEPAQVEFFCPTALSNSIAIAFASQPRVDDDDELDELGDDDDDDELDDDVDDEDDELDDEEDDDDDDELDELEVEYDDDSIERLILGETGGKSLLTKTNPYRHRKLTNSNGRLGQNLAVVTKEERVLRRDVRRSKRTVPVQHSNVLAQDDDFIQNSDCFQHRIEKQASTCVVK